MLATRDTWGRSATLQPSIAAPPPERLIDLEFEAPVSVQLGLRADLSSVFDPSYETTGRWFLHEIEWLVRLGAEGGADSYDIALSGEIWGNNLTPRTSTVRRNFAVTAQSLTVDCILRSSIGYPLIGNATPTPAPALPPVPMPLRVAAYASEMSLGSVGVSLPPRIDNVRTTVINSSGTHEYEPDESRVAYAVSASPATDSTVIIYQGTIDPSDPLGSYPKPFVQVQGGQLYESPSNVRAPFRFLVGVTGGTTTQVTVTEYLSGYAGQVG